MQRQDVESEVVLSYENIQITNTDCDCLKQYQFLNDKIINFYLKYLYCTLLNHEQKRRVHIFDSFFSEALDTMDESRVARWLRRINIFEKDYILIPALIDQHWFLVVACNVAAIIPSKSDNGDTSNKNNNNNNQTPWNKRARIVIMDSMRSHAIDKKPQLIQYLYNFFRSACVIQKNMSEQDIGVLSKQMPSFETDVKEQSNNFDCGICLLENAEKFLIETFGIRNEIDPEVEFRLTNARLKRPALRKLIRKLIEHNEIEKNLIHIN